MDVSDLTEKRSATISKDEKRNPNLQKRDNQITTHNYEMV
jgi:hypothetical protein